MKCEKLISNYLLTSHRRVRRSISTPLGFRLRTAVAFLLLRALSLSTGVRFRAARRTLFDFRQFVAGIGQLARLLINANAFPTSVIYANPLLKSAVVNNARII